MSSDIMIEQWQIQHASNQENAGVLGKGIAGYDLTTQEALSRRTPLATAMGLLVNHVPGFVELSERVEKRYWEGHSIVPTLREQFDQYLAEQSRYPLLEAHEEHILAAEIERRQLGAFVVGLDTLFAYLGRDRTYTSALNQPAYIGYVEEDYQEAVSIFEKTNLRLVISIAKKYLYTGIPISDLVGEGNIGLKTAAHKYDRFRDTKFGTHATNWIKQAVGRYAERNRYAMPIKSQYSDIVRNVIQFRQGFEEQGMSVSDEEVAATFRMTPEQLKEIDTFGQQRIADSLDWILSPDGDLERKDILPSSLTDYEDVVERVAVTQTIHGALAELTDQERQVITLLYLEAGHTNKSVASSMGISIDKVKKLRTKAKADLKNIIIEQSTEGSMPSNIIVD